MERHVMLHLFGCALVGTLIVTASPVIAQNRTPNVVFILADNVGYGDLMEAASCAVPRPLASTSLRAKDFA